MPNYMIMLGGQKDGAIFITQHHYADIDETQVRKIALAELSARYLAETGPHQQRTRCAVIQTEQRDIRIVGAYRIKQTAQNMTAIEELQPPERHALTLGWH